jgi:nicotinate phosphoribosyltransferase
VPTPASVPGLFTDLYELTMLQAYVHEEMHDRAVFSLYVRRLPEERNFLLACGLETVLDYLEHLAFTDDDVRYLASLELFSSRFLDWLPRFRFTGDVYAMPEGTPVFANEPLLELDAPLPEGQVVETFVLNQYHLQTLLASKAARVVAAAAGRRVMDFATRRMQGSDAALRGARAFHVAGVHATSNVLAGRLYGLPVAGTMAHSYIQAHGHEREALRTFARMFPGTTLLVDTYDTLAAVRQVIDLLGERPDPIRISAIRLDSGDLASLARESRRLLDAAGFHDVRIVASGGLDEHTIAAFIAAGAPIDAFGVGTDMGVSHDAPALDFVYKLAEYRGEGRTKLSTGKPVLPGRKQVFRREDRDRDVGDLIGRAGEPLPGRPLLTLVMKDGRRVPDADQDLQRARERAAREVARLPPAVRALDPADPPYPVEVSHVLHAYHEETQRRVRGRADGTARR